VTGPGYDVLVGLHVLSAIVGFGAVGVSGVYAGRARSADDPRGDALLQRYFSPGTNWAERALLVTPVLGVVVLLAGDRPAASQAWPWIGLGLWGFATAVATSRCWPAERKIQVWFAQATDPEEGRQSGTAPLRDACRTVQWSASVISVCFAGAVVVMIGQPR